MQDDDDEMANDDIEQKSESESEIELPLPESPPFPLPCGRPGCLPGLKFCMIWRARALQRDCDRGFNQGKWRITTQRQESYKHKRGARLVCHYHSREDTESQHCP